MGCAPAVENMTDDSTVPPQDRLPWVVPKNCPKWTERLADYVVNERGADLAAAGTDAQAVTQAKELTNVLRDRFWDVFRARGKEPKPREKKRKAEEAAPSPEDEEVRERQRVARKTVLRLQKKIKSLIVTKDYDEAAALIDSLGDHLREALAP